ncbi:hypothetical protein F4781DRAFT_434086 [Annulohypoxylon bovei var. microspora]|nr:hypothetical protein F4781DRAFT_434086 [Annulohypoxylon bovei var. microspora]
MKTATIATTLIAALCATLASAGVVITPIHTNQVVDSLSGDCFFGKSTPFGCGVCENRLERSPALMIDARSVCLLHYETGREEQSDARRAAGRRAWSRPVSNPGRATKERGVGVNFSVKCWVSNLNARLTKRKGKDSVDKTTG